MALTETEHLAQNLRRFRRARDLSQTQVATLAGLSQPYISALERGLRPRLDQVARLARALAVAPGALLAEPGAAAPGPPAAHRAGARRASMETKP